jgi:hypothetical protein
MSVVPLSKAPRLWPSAIAIFVSAWPFLLLEEIPYSSLMEFMNGRSTNHPGEEALVFGSVIKLFDSCRRLEFKESLIASNH